MIAVDVYRQVIGNAIADTGVSLVVCSMPDENVAR